MLNLREVNRKSAEIKSFAGNKLLGLGVYDALVRDIVDPETGDVYPAISCCNSQEMAERCTSPDAEKVIWAIKANPALNSECAILLREGFRSGAIRLLVTEYDADVALAEIKGYGALSASDKVRLQMPYIHTTLLVDELVKLQHEESAGRVRLFERSGMRKDRYSSLSYNYYVALQIAAKRGRRSAAGNIGAFAYRAPKIK